MLLFLLAAQGRAQNGLPKFEWFIGGGGEFLQLGPQQRQLRLAPPFEGAVTFRNPSHFAALQIQLTGFRYHITARSAVEGGYSVSAVHLPVNRTTILAPRLIAFDISRGWLDYVRYFPLSRRLMPYGTAGLGFTHFRSALADAGQYEPTANFGIGADIPITRRLAARLEIRDYISRLPRPLQGLSHSLTPSGALVVSLGTSPAGRNALPRFEFFFEGGASFLTGGSHEQPFVFQDANGNNVTLALVSSNIYSKAGRTFTGFRIALTRNNALEFSWSYSPNRYQHQMRTQPLPVVVFDPVQQNSIYNFPINYVRYLRTWQGLRPFVTGGMGLARFPGHSRDVNQLSANFGGGTDVSLREPVALRFELRDFMIVQPDQTGGVTHNLAPTIGLVVRFY